MSKIIEVKVPDIGDFKNVSIIEVLVTVGNVIDKEAALVTLESDKATIEIPAPVMGRVKEMLVKVGDKVSEGTPLLTLEVAEVEAAVLPVTEKPSSQPLQSTQQVQKALTMQVLVLGGGPGGYTAAFRAADLGKQVMLVERYPTLGGVCLNVGCIPSKTLLHVAQVINEANSVSQYGITFDKPKINLGELVVWKQSVVSRLTNGLAGLAKQRKIKILTGKGAFTSANTVQVETADGAITVSFDSAIIAAGSQTTKIPNLPYADKRIIDSTDALELRDIPAKLLIIGGGIIGLELATVYAALGSKITIVEWLDSLIPGCDKDLVKPLHKTIAKRYERIYLNTKVTKIEVKPEGLLASFEGKEVPPVALFDRVLVAVGRRPNGKLIGADQAGVFVNEMGFIPVDKQMRTNIPHIFAIGDIVGNPMLAHKAVHQGKIAAEVIAGQKVAFDARTIPAVAYTDPEVAWMGLTETEAQAQGIAYEKSSFPWAASGRALSIGRDEGMTKLLYDPNTKRLLGAGIVGTNAGELIAEAIIAYELGADMQDLGLSIHPHPTLSETLGFTAELAEGTITDLYVSRRKA